MSFPVLQFQVEGVKDPLHLQTAANTIALMARTLAFDSKYMSPFAKSAQTYGINTVGKYISTRFDFFLLLYWKLFTKEGSKRFIHHAL